uniref:Selenoprotein P N-terminal domain-containing protein n=1 Tax=Oreochromis niloticus TaxID=8128 RepID=I3JR88_ORENI
MYWELKRSAPTGVPVFQQQPFQNDVWEALDGDKDDFLVYDRCGLLTFHIVMPYSFLHHPFVEAAIRATYQKNICNCTVSDQWKNVSTGINVGNKTGLIEKKTKTEKSSNYVLRTAVHLTEMRLTKNKVEIINQKH